MEQTSHFPLRKRLIIIAVFHASSVVLALASDQLGVVVGRTDLAEKEDAAAQVLRLEMTHVDSHMDLISLHSPERLRRAVQNSIRRAEMFAHQAKSAHSQAFLGSVRGLLDVEDSAAPVHTSSTAWGSYVVDLALGTPPQSFNGVFDTGSDLVWRQSSPCIYCYNQTDPLFDPSKSSTYQILPCTGATCLALPMYVCDASSVCYYNSTYGDGTTSLGILSTDTLTIAGSSVNLFVFGAGTNNYGLISEEGIDGIIGMGGGPLSLVSQISSLIESKFSYCLVAWQDAPYQTSPLLFGPSAVLTGALVVSTPFISSNFPTYYYLGLQGISLNGVLLSIPPGTFDLKDDGSGGLIIDSGTTISILADEAYTPLLDAYTAAINLPQVNGSSVALDLCFDNSESATVDIPLLTFHFDGADVQLPAENIFVDMQGVGLCLAFRRLHPLNTSPNVNIYGSIQQQNFQILFDKGPANQLSFKPTTCGTL